MDVHELHVVFQSATSSANALRKDNLPQVLLLFTQHIENDAVDKRV